MNELTNNISMSKEVENKICDIINQISKKKCVLSYNTRYEEIGLDSFGFIRLVVELEKEFDIEFEDDMLLDTIFETVGNIVDFVCDKIVKN